MRKPPKSRVKEFIAHPRRSLFKLAMPIVLAMVVQIMYNIVDTAFVGRLGAESIAALTFAFPVFFMLIAISGGVGIGMGSRISRCLGAKQKKGAENAAMHGILLALGISLSVFVLGLGFIRPLFSLFGATDTVLELSIGYMSIILFGVVFMALSFVMNNFFSSQGDTKTPMKVQISALLLNIVLDPIFIYVLGFGVRGAAIATVIAMAFSVLLFVYFIRVKSYLCVGLSCFRYSWGVLKDIIKIGSSAMVMLLLMAFSIMVINWFMAQFGTDYVASFGIAARLRSFAVMPMVAFSTATLTLVGMFYGAKRYDLVNEMVRYSIKVAILFTSGVGVVFFVIPGLLVRIFTPDATLIGLAASYMRIELFSYPFMAVSMVIVRSMQGMGFGLPGVVVNFLRMIVIALPLAYLFVFVMGYGFLSIAVALLIAAVVSAGVAVVWMALKSRRFSSS
ncbi:MATE family efflux transporter [Nanoarchaeota archaeon]